MAVTKAREFRELSVDQLRQKLTEAREEIARLRFRSATEAIDNPIRFRLLRREVARLETVLKEKGK
ncbi:MAG: 50S ribosomal protein L29 [Gemmatimonadales bacterium]